MIFAVKEHSSAGSTPEHFKFIGLETGMLGYTTAYAVNYAALRIGIENHVSSLRADQVKGGFMALKDIGLALDVVFGHDCAVSIKALVASEAVSRRHRSCGFQADTYRIQLAHVAIMHKIRYLG